MIYPLINIKKDIFDLLKKTLKELGFAYQLKLEVPVNEEFDYSFPCFQIAKNEKKSPIDVANEIIGKIVKPKFIKKISQKSGYVNFCLNWESINISTMNLIDKMQEKYGIFDNNKTRVIIEHTSANPNGPLHVGRARNPIIGDTLVRIFRAAGFNVKSQFYLDDLGKQVAILTWGINNLDSKIIKDATLKSDHKYVEYYRFANDLMKKDKKISDEINLIIKKSEMGDDETLKLVHDAYKPILDGINESLKKINIFIDEYIPESTFIRDNSVEKVIDKLLKMNYLSKEDNSYFIDLNPYGVKGRNTKFYLTRNDGTTLYATRDIAYHLWKNDQADVLVNILGEDHKLESKQVEIILNLLNAKKIPIPIFYSFVSLPGGKMSTRKGRVVYLDDLINEAIKLAYIEVKKRREKELSEDKMKEISEIIGIGCLRYNIIKVQAEKDIIFNWSDALNFEGNSAAFIQYSHARACSIISKFKYNNKLEIINYSLLDHKSEFKILRNLSEYPIIIEEAYRNFKPHIIANFLYNMASNFNQFYRDCPVISEKNLEIKYVRIKLVKAVEIVIKNGLNILGIEAPDEM